MWPFTPLPPGKPAALRDIAARDPHARVRALGVLARFAQDDADYHARAVAAAELALQDPIAGVRSAACVALADLQASGAQAALLLMLEDPHGHVRQMAMSALGEIANSQAAARIARALRDERPEMRYQALIAFMRVESDPHAHVAELVRAYADTDADIRYIALRLLEEHRMRLIVADRAGVLALAVQACADSDVAVALAAAFTAARAADPAAIRIVAQVAMHGSFRGAAVPKEDEAFAVELAGELDLRECIPHLRRRAFGIVRKLRDTCAMHATIALSRMGEAGALAAIDTELASADEERRARGVVMAGRSFGPNGSAPMRAKLEALRGRVPELILDEALELLRAAGDNLG